MNSQNLENKTCNKKNTRQNGLQNAGGGMLNRLAVACRSIPGSSCRALFPAPPCYAALLCACHGSRAPWPVWTASAHAVCDRSCVRLPSACRSWTDQRPLEGVVHFHFLVASGSACLRWSVRADAAYRGMLLGFRVPKPLTLNRLSVRANAAYGGLLLP